MFQKHLNILFFFMALSACGHSAQNNLVKNNNTLKSTSKINKCICPMIYLPVCGEDKKTYSNSCQAGCAGTKYSMGSCEEDMKIKK